MDYMKFIQAQNGGYTFFPAIPILVTYFIDHCGYIYLEHELLTISLLSFDTTEVGEWLYHGDFHHNLHSNTNPDDVKFCDANFFME